MGWVGVFVWLIGINRGKSMTLIPMISSMPYTGDELLS